MTMSFPETSPAAIGAECPPAPVHAPGGGARDSRRAWLAAAGATLAASVVYGLAYSYGQFFGPMAQAFRAGDGAASVVFSITTLLGFGLSAVTGPVADRVGPRAMLLTGTVCLGLGLHLTAISDALWQAYLAYGLGIGLGVGCVYVPVLTATGRWFDRHRAVATGSVVTGVGIGTVVSSPLSAWMVSHFGWRHAYEYYAVGGAALLLLATALIGRPPQAPDSPIAAQRPPARGFRTLYVASLLVCMANYVPFAHLAPSAQRLGIGALAAAALISAIGISSIAGRLVITVLAGRFGSLTLFKACHAGIGLGLLVWATARGYGGLLAFAIIHGAMYGGYSALLPVVLGDQFGLARLGRLLGLLFTALGAGSALGPALVGYLVQSTGGYGTALAVLTVPGLLGAGVVMSYRERSTP
ncbi:MFS transporter [Streptosporangium pseudovulgare]|uniref:MFS transporter n=1 Tax=Streptosporangium pseudovulgare TaxID=35765 RepID=A0ABQ2RMC3_9ACTN|nr:MFS transporter [Streptosporangium pseudovulgare]